MAHLSTALGATIPENGKCGSDSKPGRGSRTEKIRRNVGLGRICGSLINAGRCGGANDEGCRCLGYTSGWRAALREAKLPENWLNDGPADENLFRLGLPLGVAQRLVLREFLPRLKISFISRYDQIQCARLSCWLLH